MTRPIQFSRVDSARFFRTLNRRVNGYFKENNIAKTGNWKLHLKSIIMFALYLTPYFILLSVSMSGWIKLLLTVVMGIGMAGIGMNVMHDANHGSYSKRNWVNKVLGSSIYILAGNVYNWQVQHNVLHHTYTNIEGHDEDIDAGIIIRFNEHAKWYWFHKYQHLYFIFLYGLMTFNWALVSDYKQTRDYLKRKLAYGEMPRPIRQWSVLVITKILYLSIWIVIPILVMDVPWWHVLIGFFVMHYTAGVLLSVIFQLAHVVEDSEMPQPDEEGNMKNTWAIHQLYTTVNFATKNRFVNWFTGGLNHQVEHHIYPNISHIHYRDIAKIVKETALEFDLPYLEHKSTIQAFRSHVRHLRSMGLQPSM